MTQGFKTLRAFLFSTFIAGSLPGMAAATTHLVPEEGSIALIVQNQAQPGDTLSIADGVYGGFGYAGITFDGLPLTILSRSDDPSLCELDLTGTFGFEIKNLPSGPFRIQGIGFRNASGRAVSRVNAARLELNNCHFQNNASPAVVLFSSSVVDCDFVQNTGTGNSLELGPSGSMLSGCSFLFNEGVGAYVDAGPGTSNPTYVIDCLFEGNPLGGLRTTGDAIDISGSQFLRNGQDTLNKGGGLWGNHLGALRGPSITNCLFDGNRSQFAGGALLDGRATVTGTTFLRNSAVGAGGLGLSNSSGSAHWQVADCTFSSNSATGSPGFPGSGGGASVGGLPSSTTAAFTSCTFTSNDADNGGALSITSVASIGLDQCTMSGNSGTNGASAVHVGGNSHVDLTGTTIAMNIGSSAVVADFNCHVSFSEVIIGYTEAGSALQTTPSFAGTLNFQCTDIFGNEGGDWDNLPGWVGFLGNISQDPQFCDCSAGDFSLSAGSPCLAANHPACTTDLGSQGQGCSTVGSGCGPTSLAPASWGQVKALYR